MKEVYYTCAKSFKTESIRKLSNFNFQWTKTLYQNNLNNKENFLWECQISQNDILHM